MGHTGAPGPWHDTPEEAGFRTALRRWLAEHAPQGPLPDEPEARAEALHDWHRQLAAGGYVGVSLPRAFGGRGLDARAEALVNEELGLAGAPPGPAIGHLAHALALFGTDEQRRRHLPAMLAGDERWCQGFSEPDAGSDLASLRTTAVRDDGDGTWRVEGTKVWTSLAVYADRCLLLCRTAPPGTPTRRALSLLVVPMGAPGVSCRPIVTAWGTREFAEVHFDGVVVGADAVVGEPGAGWAIAGQLLAYERGPADIGWVARLRRLLTETAATLAAAGTPPVGVQRDAWARAHGELRVLELHVRRSLSARGEGALPGSEGSLDKLLLTRVDQLVNEVVVGLGGAASLGTTGAALDRYLTARAASVFGGTSEIQRNIVAERVLGLPRDPTPHPRSGDVWPRSAGTDVTSTSSVATRS